EGTARGEARQALLAQRLRGGPRRSAAGIPTRPPGVAPLLSYAQERVWFMDQVAPGEPAYHIAVPLRIRGPLDLATLRNAVAGLTRRHESVRTRFPADEEGRPMVVIEDRVEVPLRTTEAPDEAAAWALVEQAATEPFDLAHGPLLRAVLVRLSVDDHLLLLS